jgi:ABC-2 type transport system permease protein
MRRFSAVGSFLRKEFLQILRSREMLVAIFVLPIIQLFFMGYAVSNEVKHVQLAFLDRDHSPQSRELINSFSGTDRFDLTPVKPSDTAYKILQSWRAKVVIVIPPSFGKNLTSLQRPQLQIVMDGVDGNSATIAAGYCAGIIQGFIAKELKTHDPYLIKRMTGGINLQGIDVRTRMWFNPDLRPSLFIIPGIIAVLVTMTSMLLASMSLVREKELGTMEQLMVTPVGKIELLVGKLVPFWIISFVQMSVSLLFCAIIFGVYPTGSLWALFVFSSLYLFTTLGLGIFISTWSSTQQQAMFFAWFFMVFMMLLGGLFVPVANMPDAIRVIATVNPMTHYMAVVREVVIKGSGFASLWKEFFILLTFGVVCFAGSVLTFHKRM